MEDKKIHDQKNFRHWQDAFDAKRDKIEETLNHYGMIPMVDVDFYDKFLSVGMNAWSTNNPSDLTRYIRVSINFVFLEMDDEDRAIFRVKCGSIESTYDHAFGFRTAIIRKRLRRSMTMIKPFL